MKPGQRKDNCHICPDAFCHLLKLIWYSCSLFLYWSLISEENSPKSPSGWEMQLEQKQLPSGDIEVPGLWLFGSKEQTHTFSISTIILAKGSGKSQWDVQPFLHLQAKPGASLYELEQSERNYRLNLRMNWGSERVPHDFCSEDLYIVLKDPYARRMLPSERGDCFTYLLWENLQITALPAYIMAF